MTLAKLDIAEDSWVAHPRWEIIYYSQQCLCIVEAGFGVVMHSNLYFAFEWATVVYSTGVAPPPYSKCRSCGKRLHLASGKPLAPVRKAVRNIK